MCLLLVPIGLGEISAPNKPCKSSVMKQIMLPHTSSTAMAIIHKLDLRLCFTRLSVLLYNFLIMSSEIGSVRYTKAILSSVPLSSSKPNFSCVASLLCSQMLVFTSGFYNCIFSISTADLFVQNCCENHTSSQQSLLGGDVFVLQRLSQLVWVAGTG